jgi:hypothetical protein
MVMNPSAKASLSTILLALALMVAAPHTEAASRCDGPTVGGEARACAAERQGPDALRRFVTRTQNIYGLYFGDFRHAEPDAAMAATKAPTQVATLHRAP